MAAPAIPNQSSRPYSTACAPRPKGYRSLRAGRGSSRSLGDLEGLAGPGFAEQAQAFQVIAPVEVVGAVGVVAQLAGIVLPEPNDRASAVLFQLEAEGVVSPRFMTSYALPA